MEVNRPTDQASKSRGDGGVCDGYLGRVKMTSRLRPSYAVNW